MRKKKYIWVIGLIALLINIISVYFFLNRDKFGNYTKQVSYKELYSTTANTPAVLKKWKAILDQYPETQVREGRELSREKAGLVDKEPELNRIIKIGNWLKKSFAKCAIGRPTRAFDSLTYTEQYKSAANAETPVWCGTYGNLFQFFCTINDITCRMIESFGPGDNHVVNESYLPATGEWVFTDLSHDVIYCKDKTGRVLNTIDLA